MNDHPPTLPARAAILDELAARAAATAPELAIATGHDDRVIRHVLIAMAVAGRVRRAGMAKTGAGLEVIWTTGGNR